MIGFLIPWLENSPVFENVGFDLAIRKALRDANTLVVKAAKDECEKTTGTVVVHGIDTDLLIRGGI